MKNRVTSDIWPVRLSFVLMGLAMAAVGWKATSQGLWWYSGYNPQTGTRGFGTTLWWVIAGLLFVVIGIIPWERIEGPALTLKKKRPR